MLVPGRKDLFEFQFPKSFVPTEVSAKFDDYINKQPNVINNTHEFINHTIQSVSIPTITQEPAVQQQFGHDVAYRSSKLENNLFDKELNVTFQVTEGHLNYFIMYDLFMRHYEFKNRNLHIKPFILYFTDSNGIRISKITFNQITFKSISEIQLDFTQNRQEFYQFDATFTFNKLDIELIDKETLTNNFDTINYLNKKYAKIIATTTTIPTVSTTTNIYSSVDSKEEQIQTNFILATLIFNNGTNEYEHKGLINEVLNSDFISILENNNIFIDKLSTYGNIINKLNSTTHTLTIRVHFFGGDKEIKINHA